MIESIEFTNFKALRKTTLPLRPFTLLLGPNGSGKSSVLQALHAVAGTALDQLGIRRQDEGVFALGQPPLSSVTVADRVTDVEITLRLRLQDKLLYVVLRLRQAGDQGVIGIIDVQTGRGIDLNDGILIANWLGRMQIYALDARAIAHPVPVDSSAVIRENGLGLAAVLDDLRDNHQERWEALLAEMRRWLPEYDYINFDKPQQGQKAIKLRTRKGRHDIPAANLSQGTLVALALLTLAHLPNPPTVVGLEEIDRGLHPRLLRHLQDALYRLSYPESCGETRPPIQVIATTHSPYLLDLYRDHPEEVVLAQKEGLEVEMKRLTDIENYQDIMGDSPLSEVWYSGVLGGVTVKP